MPKNPLLVYMRDNLEKLETKKSPGPVITIAREYGCLGYTLAKNLAEEINNRMHYTQPENQWFAYEKEILEQAAEELSLPIDIIEKLYKDQRKGFFADLISATPYVPDDIKIKKKVSQIILGLAYEGRSIIVGRGGVMLAKQIPNSLSIFLYAPKDKRIKRVMDQKQITKDEATRLVNVVDQERTYLRNLFAGENISYHDFDVAYNGCSLNMAEMTNSIMQLAEDRGLLNDNN